MEDYKIVQPRSTRRPARKRGPLSSESYNTFQDEVVQDVINLSTAANANSSGIRSLANQMALDNAYLKRRVDSLEESLDYKEFIMGKIGIKVDRFIDFHDTSNFVFLQSISDSKNTPFKGQFGEVFLPANSVENKFYNFSLRTSEIVVPTDLTTDITGNFDKLDGTGTQNYEKSGKVSPGNPLNAFNGMNELIWSRTVTFPIESDVDEVEVQMTVVVPAGVSSRANLIELVPFPEGSVDITTLATASDLSSTFTSVDGFAETNNLTSKRWHFPPRKVEQLKIRLRCRNWRELNGKKVFTYGLQELGLKLVDYRKEFDTGDTLGANYTSVVKVDAPEDHTFTTMYRIDPRPNFLLEDSSRRHIRLRLSSTTDFSGLFWDSDVHVAPQLVGSQGASMPAAESIYAFFTFRFVNDSGGAGSPYLVGTTPYLNGLGLLFTATPTNNN
jgi:hypothetical protein